MKKEDENFIYEKCIGLKRIMRKNKLLITLQLFLDILLISGIFLALISETHLLPFLILIILPVKSVLTAAKRDIRTCCICFLLNLSAFLISVYFRAIDSSIAAVFMISSILYLLRIKQYIVTDKLRGLFGFPRFDPVLTLNELTLDESLITEVIYQYEELENDRFLKNELGRSRSDRIIRTIRICSIVCAVAGAALLSDGLISSVDPRSAAALESIDNAVNGSLVSGTVNKIYCSSGSGMNKATADHYWCELCGAYVTFEVPAHYKEQFARLYNYYAEEQELPLYEGYISVTESSPQEISFYGFVRYPSEYEPHAINKAVLKDRNAENIAEFYIELADPDSADSVIDIGLLMMIIGIAGYILSCLSILPGVNVLK